MVDYTQKQSNPRYTAYVLQKRWLWLHSNQKRGRKRQDYNGLFVQCKLKSFSKIILKCYLGGSNYMLSAVQIFKINVQYLTFLWHNNLRYDGLVCWTITNILEEHTASVKVTIHRLHAVTSQGCWSFPPFSKCSDSDIVLWLVTS